MDNDKQITVKKLIQAEQKIKELILEVDLYRDIVNEMESHRLTRFVRGCQKWTRRFEYKIADIYSGIKYLVRMTLPRQSEYRPDCRSQLYQSLVAHFEGQNKNDN